MKEDMNKQVFMNSMSSAGETAMKLGITGDYQVKHEQSLVTAAQATAEKEVADRNLPEEEVKAATKEAVDLAVEKAKEGAWGEALCKKSKEAFDLTNKSIRAFHKANKKAEWALINYDESLDIFKKIFGVVGTTEDWKLNVSNLVGILGQDLDKPASCASVPHDNGEVWKKGKNDIKRFDQLDQIMKDIVEIVS